MKRKVDKAINLRYGLFFVVGVFFLLAVLISRAPAKAQTSFNPDEFGNVHGFAWSDTIGRTSFNCNNDFDGDEVIEESESQCQTSSYGVKIDAATLEITGFAWSDNVGWVCFGLTCASYSQGLPPGAPLGEGIEIKAWLDTDGLAHGWAKIISLNSGGGWLSLNGFTTDKDPFSSAVNFNANTDIEPAPWNGYAWQREGGGPGLGWFNFNGVVTDVLPPCQNGQIMACGSNIDPCQAGQRVCVGNQWGDCQGAIVPPGSNCGGGGGCTPTPEICDGVDDDCDGLVDEVASCQFQVVLPKGIYEPLCCADGATPTNRECPPNHPSVFCNETSQELLGSRRHVFEVKLQNAQAPDGTNVVCHLNKAGTPQSFSGQLSSGVFSFSYLPKASDIFNNQPWILSDCQVGAKTQEINQPIYVHSNNWTDRGENSDLAHALACYGGASGVYFNNKARCDFEGDAVFVRSMARGVPIDLNCDDCSSRWCQGIAYNCQ